MIDTFEIQEYNTNYASPRNESSGSDSDSAFVKKVTFTSHRFNFMIDPSDSNDKPTFDIHKASTKDNHLTSLSFCLKSKDVIHQYINSTKYLLTKAPQQVIRDLFLPIGYPDSVRTGYLEYQFYDSIQGLSSYLRGVITTSAVLTAAGVGDAEATAISTAVNWALRDGLGMTGGLIFSYVASKNFDSHVKEFRLFADVINDIGLTLDMLAPYFVRGNSALYVSSLATLCRVMCGISAGATKSSITQHFALRGNIADLNAKEGTQETLVSLIGMLMGIALAHYLHILDGKKASDNNTSSIMSTSKYFSWIMFSFLTLVHVWANYLGVKMLRLRTLNRERAEMAFAEMTQTCADYAIKNFMSYNRERMRNELGSNIISSHKIAQPDDINESMYKSMKKLFFSGGIVLGARLHQTLCNLPPRRCHQLIKKEFEDEGYIISVKGDTILRKFFQTQNKVFVTVRIDASEIYELKALIHALILKHSLSKLGEKQADDILYDLISITHDITDLMSNSDVLSLETLEKSGWSQERLYLGYSPWRAQWKHIKKKNM